ncbi:MAG: fimbria/pilus outer membrane usher protein [Gibbsiella quercinecans]|uniref:fimbria/pilus outer membrane usher protein n=1 Tax=Gibbsiella quercinecans TaxID=929813 RepID=UPI003F2E79F2
MKNKKEYSPLYFNILCLLLAPLYVFADASNGVAFDDAFLKNMPGVNVDVSRFANGNPISPGDYLLDIYLNGRQVGKENVRVVDRDGELKICLSYNLVKSLAIKNTVLTDSKIDQLRAPASCVVIEDIANDSQSNINMSDMQMDISIPQIYLVRNARGYVDPALWDKGETALTLNYNTNIYHSGNSGQEYTSFYGRALAGFNFAGWMLRHEGGLTWQKDTREYHNYNNINTYVQKDIPAWKSRLTLGEGNTSGDIFDTQAFRGVQLASVDQMWPDSQRGFAPEIHGVARTNAQVVVSQNGSKIYETTVSPGAFVISDLYPTGFGGDLDVIIKEADGSEKRFSVPYASVAKLKRPGMTYYSLTGGVSRLSGLVYRPNLYQATVQRGINNNFTAYGGMLGSNNYISFLLGGAFGLPIGAFAFDVSTSHTEYGDNRKVGSSYRATYSKKVSETNTSFSLAAYRFSSSGYYSFNDAVRINDYYKRYGNDHYALAKAKSRISLTASQSLGATFGSIYATGFIQNYWNASGSNTQFQLGYNNTLGKLAYTLSANRLLYSSGGHDTQVSLDFSLPLGESNKNFITGTATQTREGLTAQTSYNGVAGDYNQYSYGISAARGTNNDYSSSVNGLYRSPYTTLQASYSKGRNYYSTSASANGSMVALSDSLTLSAYQTTTFAVVNAKDAEGAHLVGYPNVVLDKQGRAIVPNLNPYRINELAIDPKGIPFDVELEATSQSVVPVSGAVVKVNYKTTKGKTVLIRANQNDGNALPFGAEVTDESGNAVTTVTQGGQIYLRLNQDISRLNVSWGGKEKNLCFIDLESGKIQEVNSGELTRLSTTCTTVNGPSIRYVSNGNDTGMPRG